MTTDEEIARLERDALDAQSLIWVAHFFSHHGSSSRQRAVFCSALADAGFGVGGVIGSDEEVTGDGYWFHYTYTRIAAKPDDCRRMDECAGDIAALHGVRYDRWEVARDYRTGRVRDLTGHWLPK